MGKLEGKLDGDVKVAFRVTAHEREREGVLIGTFKCSSLVLTGASRGLLWRGST